ncbi:Integrase, catalytic core [Corchorus capsularis]|uniref:Integrase, catalytic core n=1 Tax=Corchorus capsularis TaxID=210143 RepID=A0A1R3JQ86_COCAP|nr:Integrase, catalytic core [Corchorus capsularis]
MRNHMLALDLWDYVVADKGKVKEQEEPSKEVGGIKIEAEATPAKSRYRQDKYKALFFLLKQKSEVAEVFWKFKAIVEKQNGSKIKVIRTDNGSEYTTEKFDKYCSTKGIEHQLTVTYSPQQNGVSERKNRTVMDMASLVPSAKREKLDKRSKAWIFVGYSQFAKGYRVYIPATKKVIVSRDVKFDEEAVWRWSD